VADTSKSKRAPGESPALSFFVAGLKGVVAVAASIAILVVGWTSWGWYRPDLLIGPINRHVHLAYLECRDTERCPTNWGGWRSMVPDVFEIGGQHDDVIKRLRDAGFEEWYVDGGEENHRRIGAALSPLFCSKYYNIKVVFDPSGQLASSESTFTGTPSCL
jgi:hypothetical protein